MIDDCTQVEKSIQASNAMEISWTNMMFLVLFNYYCVEITTPYFKEKYPKTEEKILLNQIRKQFDTLKLITNNKIGIQQFEIILNDYETRLKTRQQMQQNHQQKLQFVEQQKIQEVQQQLMQKLQFQDIQQQSLVVVEQQSQQQKQLKDIEKHRQNLHSSVVEQQNQQQVQGFQQKNVQLEPNKQLKFERNNFDILLSKAFYYTFPQYLKKPTNNKYYFNIIEANHEEINNYLTIRKTSTFIQKCLNNVENLIKLYEPGKKSINENLLIIETTLLNLGDYLQKITDETNLNGKLIRSGLINYGLPVQELIELMNLRKKYPLFSIIEFDDLKIYFNGILAMKNLLKTILIEYEYR